MTSIAEKYAAQWMPNGEVSLADLIQAAVDEAQSVPVVGDVVNIPVMQQVTPELASLAYQRAFNGNDSVDFSLRIARHVAVLLLCVDSITAAELATLREKAAMADELRKDAEKWRDLCSRVGADPSGAIAYAGPLEGAPEDWAAIAQEPRHD